MSYPVIQYFKNAQGCGDNNKILRVSVKNIVDLTKPLDSFKTCIYIMQRRF